MENQLLKHRRNLEREACRKGVTAEQLENISKKIGYYEEAVVALRERRDLQENDNYPCVYHDNGKCQKFSDDTYNAWCINGPCEDQVLSNADHIRSMTDEELATELLPLFEELCEDGIPSPEYMWFWFTRPYKEETDG